MSVDTKDRRKAAILGAFVADAASMPLHWIYDAPKIQQILAEKGVTETPEFFDPPSCPFYKHEAGTSSPYGDEVAPLLRSMAELGGLQPEKAAEAVESSFLGGSRYQNHSVKTLLANRAAGQRWPQGGDEQDFQANCFARVPLVVAKYAGAPELLARVEDAVRLQQNNDEAVKFGKAAARVMERVILGDSVMTAVIDVAASGEVPTDVFEYMQRALNTVREPLTELTYDPPPFMAESVQKVLAAQGSLDPYTVAVWCNGPSCGNPGAFVNALTCALLSSNFVDATRRNIVAGGDNASRSMFVGGLLAAQGTLSSIPESWREKFASYSEFEALASKLLDA